MQAVPPDEPLSWRARERVALIGELRRAAGADGPSLKVSVQQGDPADVILVHAHARRPDLIVLGTHRRRGMHRLRHGSVAEGVTVGAPAPVLIVPPNGGRGDAAAPSFGSVVAAVDLTDDSAQVVEAALTIAASPAMRVTVVHVVRPQPPTGVPRYPTRFADRESPSAPTRRA